MTDGIVTLDPDESAFQTILMGLPASAEKVEWLEDDAIRIEDHAWPIRARLVNEYGLKTGMGLFNRWLDRGQPKDYGIIENRGDMTVDILPWDKSSG